MFNCSKSLQKLAAAFWSFGGRGAFYFSPRQVQVVQKRDFGLVSEEPPWWLCKLEVPDDRFGSGSQEVALQAQPRPTGGTQPLLRRRAVPGAPSSHPGHPRGCWTAPSQRAGPGVTSTGNSAAWDIVLSVWLTAGKSAFLTEPWISRFDRMILMVIVDSHWLNIS